MSSRFRLAAPAILSGLVFALVSHADANIPSSSERIAQTIRRELHANVRTSKKNSFSTLLDRWSESYGSAAVSPLLQVASDDSLDDPERYAALMGAAKLGGTASTPLLVPFLKDRSWMLRSGALRALSALQETQESRSVLPLLRDPALVVRVEAVDAIEKLRPEGSLDALVGALRDPQNYHAKKAQWVPQRVLRAIGAMKAKEAAPKLRPLLSHSNDPELQLRTIETLEALLGTKVSPALALSERARRWERLLQD